MPDWDDVPANEQLPYRQALLPFVSGTLVLVDWMTRPRRRQ